MSEKIAVLILSGFILSACVSTTTGTLKPEPDESDAAKINYQLGARYFQNGKYDLARDRLLLAIEMRPKMAVAHTMLGMTYEALDNLRLATESYESAVRVAPRDFDVQNAYAVFLCRHRDFEGARKYFEKAANHPENDNAERTLTNAGLCMAQKPDVAEAFRGKLDKKEIFGSELAKGLKEESP